MREDDFSGLEVLEDPEMILIGQRLIMQGGELLDDTDLEPADRRKVERIISDCWNDLSATKIYKETFLSLIKGYEEGRQVPAKKGMGLNGHFRGFLLCAAKVLDRLARMLLPLTHGRIPGRSYLRCQKDIARDLDALESIPKPRAEALSGMIRKLERRWVGDFTRFCGGIGKNGGGLVFERDGSRLQSGRPALKILLPDGRDAAEWLRRSWEDLVDFCEEFMAHAIGLRFFEFVEMMEDIPKRRRDPVYSRRFRTVVRGASSENGETPASP